ncbi:hypothetical protein [Actibacterium pelagium]|uniref:Membrane protein YjdF n=1 Tax=Actibacterium pelagium TaxID=2029103 RepID=A0A917AF28_9RHOB|nr:hypothetical protein [Actibacterium pelagium]GGE47050.1 hypothetical protein GCM10011517_13510 [Actibacterium pelagium]
MKTMSRYTILIKAIRLFLVGELIFSGISGQWSVAFVSIWTLLISYVPTVISRRLGVQLPVQLLALITLFIFATLFLGEVWDFYGRYWWWDVVLHGGSAMAFGLMGVVFVLLLFEGDRYAAPPFAMSVLAFCVAISIGASWEVFEFLMDQIFGLNMQKSGLMDTMWDMIVDMIGAFIGATIGFFYLKGRELGGSAGMIREFIRLNRQFFRRHR